ncbi:MAG: hypothetical protein AB1650_04405 [Candidatus Omnitrophota bacterium]
MKKGVSVAVGLCLSCFLLTGIVWAKSAEEYVDQAYQLINQRQFEQALDVLREGYQNYPGDIGLVWAMSECYQNLGDYETAIANYVNIINAIEAEGGEAPGQLHYNLVDAYNELGQKHYFSPELCLRIIYHLEKSFELTPEMTGDKRYIEFLKKSIGHYDVASMGSGNVKMMETGGDGLDFDLPEDNISQESKMTYMEKAKKRVDDFDSQEKAMRYPTVKSDRTTTEINIIINQKIQKISPVHFKKKNSGKVVEEIFYDYPDKFKVVDANAISVVNGNRYYVIDKNTEKIVNEQEFDLSDVETLKSLLLPNLNMIAKYYKLEIERFESVPNFLNDIYSQGVKNNLYLVTAKLKNEDECPFYPPVVKIEYFIDTDLGLALGIRNYWLGILGSGQEDELADETIVTAIQQVGNDNVFFPKSGITVGHTQEMTNLNEKWSIEIISAGSFLSSNEFDVDRYRQ